MRVGTFNLNNLFSRDDFTAEVNAVPGGAAVQIVTEVDPADPAG
jgi:hypothetical protein